jgi:hypothetical protein
MLPTRFSPLIMRRYIQIRLALVTCFVFSHEYLAFQLLRNILFRLGWDRLREVFGRWDWDDASAA